jgi:sortase (surface protein transpeptidase)
MMMIIITILIIQFNSLFIYVLTQQLTATDRVSTDTNNRNNGQHRDNIQKPAAFNRQVLSVYIKI